MEREQAREIAGELLTLERVADDHQAFDRDLDSVTASLVALLPDLGDTWAVLKLVNATTGADRRAALALHEGVVWTASITRTGVPGADPSPRALVNRYPPDSWRLLSVGDGVTRDGAAKFLRREWTLDLAGDAVIFSSEQHLSTTPHRSPTDRLGQALAAEQDWTVGDLSVDHHGRFQ
jgi:hypothetical protein